MRYRVRPRPRWAIDNQATSDRCECGELATHYGVLVEPHDPIPTPLTLGCELCMHRWARERNNPKE